MISLHHFTTPVGKPEENSRIGRRVLRNRWGDPIALPKPVPRRRFGLAVKTEWRRLASLAGLVLLVAGVLLGGFDVSGR